MRHAVLASLTLLWLGGIVASAHYRDLAWLQYLFVDLTWIQVVLLAAGGYGAFLVAAGVVAGWRQPPRPRGGARPMVSIIVPAKDEAAVIEGTVRALAALDYHEDGRPRYEIIVVDDQSTDGTGALLERLAAELPLTVVRTPEGSVGKAAALNLGTARARADLIAVFDADARVAPDFLDRLVPELLAPRVGGVQSCRMVSNAAQNALTRVQDDEYRLFQRNLQRARQALGGMVCLSGNGLIVRREAIEEVGGWHEEALTEDIDLSVRFHLAGWEIRYRDDAIVWEEAVPSVGALIRQRTRWFEGGVRCLGDHLPGILIGRIGTFKRVDMFFFLGGALLVSLALLTTYLYAAIDLAGAVVLYLQLPRSLTTISSVLMSAAILLAAAAEHRARPWRLVPALLGLAVFSLHRLVLLPLAAYRYVRSAITGELLWEKTAHGASAGVRAGTKDEG
ncbi:MAG TPA: glycosyltransferase family 2 protein [bacterium]|nr:glycosyltransferase family 2 protein [bacterium]